MKALFTALFLAVLTSHASANLNTTRSGDTDLLIQTDTVKIGGTLSLPSERASDALVIMLSGSGPQDRDETLDGFKVFKTLEGHLTQQGIPSFRFDDRGVGKSSGDFGTSTLEDHTRDVHHIIRYFSEHPEYPFRQFVLLGHSQGGIVSAHVAISNPAVKKVILMGAPAVPLVDIVLYQVRQEHQASALTRAQIEEDVSAHNRLMWAIREEGNLKDVREAFIQSARTVLADSNPKKADINRQALAKADEFSFVYAMPSLTSFLYHDTAKDYAQLRVPVLGLFGGKDLQVTIEQNKDAMEMALLKASVPYAFVTFDDANHYFQQAITGQRDEYETLEKRFVSRFAETVSQWILSK